MLKIFDKNLSVIRKDISDRESLIVTNISKIDQEIKNKTAIISSLADTEDTQKHEKQKKIDALNVLKNDQQAHGDL